MSDLSEALAALAPRLDPAATGISGLIRLSGGASQETYAFKVELSGGLPPRPLILRRAPGARTGEGISLSTEAAVMQAAGRAGAPVAPVLYVCAQEDGLGEAFFMGRVEGETIARKILRDAAFAPARTVLAAQCGQALARIHATQRDGLPELTVSDGAGQLARYREIYSSFGVHRPIMELAFSWLEQRQPEPVPTTLVHGDFRNGNLMVAPDGLAAVLDWELAHLGDPREDLGWICVNSWRFGASHNPVGGFGSRADLLEAYRAAGGLAVDESQLRWFEMLGTLKWGVMCLIMYQAFVTGADPSVERAMIGRRASETEIDLINLMRAAAQT